MAATTTNVPSILEGLTKDQMKARSTELDKELAEVKERVLALRGKPDMMEEYTAAFKRMSEVDANSLIFLLAAVRDEMRAKQVAAHPLPTTQASEDFRKRAVGAIVGSLVADAASVGTEWIYDMPTVERLSAEKKGDLSFFEPLQSTWLQAPHYHTGALSPYGEQLYTLVKSMSEAQGLDIAHYCHTNYLHFDSDVQAARYRDTLVKTFLRAVAHGKAAPETGSDDQQAHSPVRAAAIAVAYAGSSNLDAALDSSIRVFQNKDGAVAFATLHAHLMGNILSGKGLQESIDAALTEAKGKAAAITNEATKKAFQDAIQAAEDAVTDARNQTTSTADFTTKVGRHCGCPAGYQVPLHVILTAAAQNGTEDKQKLFVEAVKLALLQGGDSASRNSIVGAVLGAYGGLEAIPQAWIAKCSDYEHWKEMAEKLVAIRA